MSLTTREMQLTESNVELGKTVLGVSLRDGVEHDRVVQDMVVEGEVTAKRRRGSVFRIVDNLLLHSRRDRVDTLALDALPSLLLDILGNSLQVLGRGLEGPVGLDGLFDFSVGTWRGRGQQSRRARQRSRFTDSGETQNSGSDT
jgi:hypothetical protein